MDLKQTLVWFEEIAATTIKLHPAWRGETSTGWSSWPEHFDLEEATRWVTAAQSALESIFPPSHAVMKRWHSALAPAGEAPAALEGTALVQAAQAVFQSAVAQVKAGRLGAIADSVRAETVAEVLDQADALVAKHYGVAATVLAGGALETHLRHLCVRHSVTWAGSGSISSYNDAIAQSRNGGHEIYSANDGKMVTGWGGLRNTAAHDPIDFSSTAADVRLMLQGIRQFVSRTS